MSQEYGLMCTSCLLAGSLHVRWCHPHFHWLTGGCPHACNLCGKPAGKFGRHDLHCRSSQERASHQNLNKSDPLFIGLSKHSQQTGTIRPIQSWWKALWWGDLVLRTSPYPPHYGYCTRNCTTAVTQWVEAGTKGPSTKCQSDEADWRRASMLVIIMIITILVWCLSIWRASHLVPTAFSSSAD